MLQNADAATVRRAIEELPPEFREALVLREMEELSYRQIAEITGVPIGTVMSRLSRARNLLRQKPGAAGGERGMTMKCEEARPIIDVYADDQLDVERSLEIERILNPAQTARAPCSPRVR